jgi:CheY-like chemotaxis protein
LTGYGLASDRQATTEAGFDHHLVKPVQPSDLFAAIADVGIAHQPRKQSLAEAPRTGVQPRHQ